MSFPPSRRRKTEHAFDHVRNEGDLYNRLLQNLPLFAQNFAANHPYWFWGLTIGTPVVYVGMREMVKTFNKKVLAEAEERRRKEN